MFVKYGRTTENMLLMKNKKNKPLDFDDFSNGNIIAFFILVKQPHTFIPNNIIITNYNIVV